MKDLTASIPEEPYDIWNGSRFLFAKDLFPDKLSDLGGKVLRATTFQNFPTTYQVRTRISHSSDDNDFQNSDGSRGGWEYFIITTLAENMNFKLAQRGAVGRD